jgi:NhaP-type Na+/H+ or K+/H+ antiporter
MTGAVGVDRLAAISGVVIEMYQNAAFLAAFLLIYSAVAGRIERSLISGPIVFTVVGLLLGPDGLGVLRTEITGEGLRLLAELTLAMVLFTDAANADFGVVRANLGLPERLLGIGLPLTIVLGFLFAAIVFPSLDILEMALLATILAPTDAALGKPVVANPMVPAVMREALNLESGLNDGICVPIVVILLGLAVGTQIEGGTMGHVAWVVVEEIGIGLIAGLGLTWLTIRMLRSAEDRGWISEHWVEIPIVALAAACFAAAQAAGGSGFIACFVGGLLLSGLGARHKAELLRGAEHMGEALALLTWVVFGGIVIPRMIDRVTWPAVVYAGLSLTVVRMLPVFLCLIGTRTSASDKLFIGWFGPRGLATIVFAILVLDAKLPGNNTMMVTAGWTVILSIVAHGVTANPLVKAIGRRREGLTE